MPGKRGVSILGRTVMIPSDHYTVMEMAKAIVNRTIVRYRGLNEVETLYHFAREDRKGWRLWDVVLGTGEGNLTYSAERPKMVLPTERGGGDYDAPEFIIDTSPGVDSLLYEVANRISIVETRIHNVENNVLTIGRKL